VVGWKSDGGEESGPMRLGSHQYIPADYPSVFVVAGRCDPRHADRLRPRQRGRDVDRRALRQSHDGRRLHLHSRLVASLRRSSDRIRRDVYIDETLKGKSLNRCERRGFDARRHRRQLKTRRPTTDASSDAQHLTKTDGRSAACSR